MIPNEILTAHEVATLLRVHYSTVMRLVRERKIPAFRLGTGGRGGDWRFVRSQLQQWMQETEVKP